MTNFLHAIAAHRNEVLPQLCADDLATTNDEGRTLLMEAAVAGNTAAVKHLCAMGADVHAVDQQGNTALHLSAEEGGHAAALLLAAGADPKAVNKAGDTPLIHALTCGHAPSVRLLLQAYSAYGINIGEEEDSSGTPALIHAMWNGSVVEVKLLLALGADARECDADGDTPLLLAARFGHVAVARLLLRAGADPNACNQEEKTALQYAVRHQQKEMIDLLLSAGARTEVEDIAGFTPLSFAVSQGRFDIATMLVEAGADITARFPNSKMDMLWPKSTMEERSKEICISKSCIRLVREIMQFYHTPGEEAKLNYLLLAVLHVQPAFARLLVRRCPSLLLPEAEEAFYRFVSVEPEYY